MKSVMKNIPHPPDAARGRSARTRRRDRSPISAFIEHNFRHFNAATLVDAARGYKAHVENGGKMLVTLAGAMSTAELGVSLAEMIRRDKVHAVCCTGANLEEDIFNLVAHSHYERLPEYRHLTPIEEEALLKRRLNRVTDTCIPEEEAIRRIESHLKKEWLEADKDGISLFPHEFLFNLIRKGILERYYEIDPRDSWVVTAVEKNLPVFVPGWEDSTLGNIYASKIIGGMIANAHTVRSGIEYMDAMSEWYLGNSKNGIGFFQIGGGIAGDFAICVVPMLRQDLQMPRTPLWAYFCQISDSTTSYGSYSGAAPNEKITWEKLGKDTPRFVIESDATIVAPLVFAYVLGR
ncbi:MAG: deoxyhypusine synthase family protein [bacterium]|jgi:deoxyhypusine synthase